jgi:hypothetical protein
MMISNFFGSRTLTKKFCVSREGYYLSEYPRKSGENCLLPPPLTSEIIVENQIFTSNTNKIT